MSPNLQAPPRSMLKTTGLSQAGPPGLRLTIQIPADKSSIRQGQTFLVRRENFYGYPCGFLCLGQQCLICFL